MERNKRKIILGKVISAKAAKTITVLVETYTTFPIYKKRVMYSKKYQVHDEKSEAHVGDRVEIMECRPLSATKRFRLHKIVERASALQQSEAQN